MKKSAVIFIIVFNLLFLSLIVSASSGYYSNYAFPASGKLTLDISRFNKSQASFIADSLNSLAESGEIKSYFTDNEKIIVDVGDDKFVRFEISDKGLFLASNVKSYIVQFKSPSLLEKRKMLDSMDANQKEFEDYKKNIASEHYLALKDIKARLRENELASLGFFGRLLEFFKKIFQFSGFAVLDNDLEIMPDEEFYNSINGVVLELSEKDAQKIKQSVYVKQVYVNEKVYADLADSVPLIGASRLWKMDKYGNNCSESDCLTGKGIKIAIIDSGIDYTHPDMGGCFGPGCKVEGGYDFVNNDENPLDDNGHGTHCAGIAAGNGALKGVAPDAKLYAYKTLNSDGMGSSSSIIKAIERSLDPNMDGNFSDKLDVISLSLGGSGNPDDPLSQAIDSAVDAGVIAVVAAGNSGPKENSITTPGCARNALTVGAVDKSKKIADFSSRGPVVWPSGSILKPDVAAPGVLICSSLFPGFQSTNPSYSKCFDDSHILLSGTSMATPHVAGAAALIRQASSELSSKEIKSLLEISADDLGYDLNAQGNGMINLTRALGTKIIFSETRIDFANASEKIIKIKNIGNTSISLSFVAQNAKNEQNKNYYDIINFDSDFITILPGEEYPFVINLIMPEGVDGIFSGKILASDGTANYSLFYSASRFSRIKVKVEGDHMPYFYIHDNNNPGVILSALQGKDFIGNEFTFAIPHGNYTVYAINDFLMNGETDEYILMDSINVGLDAFIEKNFRLTDERIFTVPAKSISGKDLLLFEWIKAVIIYPDEKNVSSDTAFISFSDPLIGDRKVYISNKPDNGLNIDIMLKFFGVSNEI